MAIGKTRWGGSSETPGVVFYRTQTADFFGLKLEKLFSLSNVILRCVVIAGIWTTQAVYPLIPCHCDLGARYLIKLGHPSIVSGYWISDTDRSLRKGLLKTNGNSECTKNRILLHCTSIWSQHSLPFSAHLPVISSKRTNYVELCNYWKLAD